MESMLKSFSKFFILISLVLGMGFVCEASEQDITLETQELKITFDETTGQPKEFMLLPSQESFSGADVSENMKVTFKRITNGSKENVVPQLQSHTTTEGVIKFNYQVMDGDTQAGAFQLVYEVKGKTLYVYYHDLIENNGYKIMEIGCRSVVILEDGPGASFVYNTPKGRLVKLEDAQVGELNPDDSWFNPYPNLSILPVAAILQQDAVCTMEVTGYLSQTFMDVKSKDNSKYVSMGASIPVYVEGGSDTPDLPVIQTELLRLDFGEDVDANGEVNWIDCAHLIKGHMPPIPSHYFDDKLAYVLQGEMGLKNPTRTFSESELVAKGVHALIDGNPQIMYIAGWAEGGHDTAYPNYTQLNESLGGSAGFFKLKENAKNNWNAEISFDDNYDDQYDNEYSAGFYVEKYIARKKDGGLDTFRAWNGRDHCRITGMAKYMVPGGPGEQRIDYMCNNYQLDNSELIDGMSWWSVRHDWDPNNPASAVKNLYDGKFKLIDRYRDEYGVEVVSELLRYPFIGKLSLVFDGLHHQGAASFGGAGYNIPFASFVLRDTIIVGGKGGMHTGHNDPKEVLFNNVRRHAWIMGNTTDEQIQELYYFNYVPWFVLHNLEILEFESNNDVVDMVLSDNSAIHIDYNTNRWYAEYKGNRIWENYDISCPMSDGRIAFYSREGGLLKYPVPANVSEQDIQAKVLEVDQHANYPFEIVDGYIQVNVPSSMPVIVYTNGEMETYTTINDSEESINYVGSWKTLDGRKNDYKGDVKGTYDNGDYVEYTFNGTGIEVITENYTDMGEVNIYIDGELEATVNCHYATRLYQQAIYSNKNLVDGEHTIKIEKVGGEWCLIDGFKVYTDVEAEVVLPDLSKVNNTSTRINYSPNWTYHNGRNSETYLQDVNATKVNGAYAEITFVGTGIAYVTEMYNNQGEVDIILDGQLVQTVNTYNETRIYNHKVYEVNGLTPGEHTLKIVKKSGEYILLDYFKITDVANLLVLNDDDSSIVYTGDWIEYNNRGGESHEDDVMATKTNGDYLIVEFNGTGIEIIAEKYKDQGTMDIFIDGEFITTIDCSSQERLYNVSIFQADNLEAGLHTLKAVKKSGEYMLVDAFHIHN